MPNDETFAMPEGSDGRTREPTGERPSTSSPPPKRPRRGKGPRAAFGVFAVAAGAIVGCATIADLRDPMDGLAGTPIDEKDADATDTGANTTPMGEVVVSPSALDFGDVACGKAPTPKVLRIENQGSEDHPYEVKLPEGTAFSFVGASAGTVKAGDVALVSIAVTPKSAEDLVTDLAVRIDDRISYVPLRATGLGGQLDVAPTLVDFGELRAENAESSPITVVFQNTGNRDLTVTSIDVSNNDFQVTFPDGTPEPAIIAPGKSLTAKAILVNGIAGPELTATATIETPLACTKPPSISLRGRRGNAKITVTPGTVDVGDVVCKQPVTTKKEIVVSNYENAPLGYQIQPLPANSRFVVESGGMGTILAAADPASPQTATIVVTAKPVDVPAAAVSETLRIDFSSGGGGTSYNDVTLTMRPAGAVITADPPDLNYNIFNRTITLTNAGNLAVTLDYKTTSDSAKEFDSTRGSVSVEGSKTGAVNVNFWNGLTPKGATYQATIVLTKKSGGELCTDLPVLKAHTTY